MHTMTFTQENMKDMMNKIISRSLTNEALTEITTTPSTTNLLVADRYLKALSALVNDMTMIINSPQDTVYFFKYQIMIQDGRMPNVELNIQATTPSAYNFFEFSPQTLTFIKQYLLDTRIIPNPYDIA
ncbi:hypothetical protein AB9M75_07500 [Lactobacillus sp. AN1001]